MSRSGQLSAVFATILSLAGIFFLVVSPAMAQSVAWVSQFGGGVNGNALTAVAVDGSGNIYVAGYVSGPLPGQTFAGGITDAFVRKYDTNKNILWTREFGSISDDAINAMALDAAGNAYVAGYTMGTLPGQTPAGSADIFVSKLDTNGNQIWIRQFGSTGVDLGQGVAVDGSGNVIVAGSVQGTLPGQTSVPGSGDAFLRKYDPSGTELWTRQFGTPAIDASKPIEVDSAGNIYVGGSTSGALPGQTNVGDNDAFLRKYDTNGTEVWTRQFGSTGRDELLGLAIDSSGNIYATGQVERTLPGQTSAGDFDAFLRKYSSAGTELWTRQFGSTAFDGAQDVVADNVGGVYVVGYTYGTFPGQTAAGDIDDFLRQYDTDGYVMVTRHLAPWGWSSPSA